MKQRVVITVFFFLVCSYATTAQQPAPPNINIDGYSDKRFDMLTIVTDSIRTANNTIVIINKKIYTLFSTEFKKLKKENILDMELIKDESSLTAIKNILIIKTKEE